MFLCESKLRCNYKNKILARGDFILSEKAFTSVYMYIMDIMYSEVLYEELVMSQLYVHNNFKYIIKYYTIVITGCFKNIYPAQMV